MIRNSPRHTPPCGQLQTFAIPATLRKPSRLERDSRNSGDAPINRAAPLWHAQNQNLRSPTLSMLSDYKRIIEKPMIESYEATIAAQRTEIERLRLRMAAILTWHANWDAPWHGEDEWREDLRLAKNAASGQPD